MSNGVDDNSQVRGHAGDPGNKRCAQLAVQAAQQADLPIDQGCESPAVSTTTYTELSTKEGYMPSSNSASVTFAHWSLAVAKPARMACFTASARSQIPSLIVMVAEISVPST